MSVRSEQLMRRLWQVDGVIMRERGAHVLPIHPKGDRRRRAIGWIDAADVQDWLAMEVLELGPRGYRLSADIQQCLRHGQSPHEIEARLRRRRERVRAATSLPQIETFDRLRDRDGHRVFTDAQVEAARRFHRDLRRAGQADGPAPAASDLAAPQVDGTRRHDAAEDAAIARIDAGRTVARAKRGLDRRVVHVITRVIAADEPITAVEGAQGWTPGVGAALMQIGLDHLVRHYGVRRTG